MKKMLIALVAIFSFAFANAQPPSWTTNTTGKCFCCNPYYNLPTPPPITGPTVVDCNKPATFSTTPCPGATYQWSISPALTTTSGGTTANFTINPTYFASNYTITVTIRCGEKTVTNQIQIVIRPDDKCKPDFLLSLTELPGGLYQVNGSGTPGYPNFWLLEKVTCPCPGNNPITTLSWLWLSATCADLGHFPATPAPITTSGCGFQFGGLIKGNCYRLTHYVYCCGQWKRQQRCFTITLSPNARMSSAELNGNAETRNVQVNELPAELKQILSKGEQRHD